MIPVKTVKRLKRAKMAKKESKWPKWPRFGQVKDSDIGLLPHTTHGGHGADACRAHPSHLRLACSSPSALERPAGPGRVTVLRLGPGPGGLGWAAPRAEQVEGTRAWGRTRHGATGRPRALAGQAQTQIMAWRRLGNHDSTDSDMAPTAERRRQGRARRTFQGTSSRAGSST